MSREPLDNRLPQIWHRLDPDGLLADFLGVVDSEYDRIHDKIGELFDLRTVDRCPERYLPLLAPLVGHVWRTDKDHAWNRRRIRHAIARHSYKGTLARLGDVLADLGVAAADWQVIDMASKLVQFSAAKVGMSALVDHDYWHDGAFVLVVPDGDYLDDLRTEMAATCMGGERWFLRIVTESVLEPIATDAGTFGKMAGWLTVDDDVSTIDRDDLTVGLYLPSVHGPLWLGLGKTQPWTDEETPPTPLESDTDITEPFLFVRARRNQLCLEVLTPPDEGLGVTVDGRYFEFTDEATAYTEATCWIYFEALVDRWVGMPTGTFRQAGIFMMPQHNSDKADPSWLLPSQVTDHGGMGCLTNFTAKKLEYEDQRLFRMAIQIK